MATHNVWKRFPKRISPKRFALNGRAPNPAAWRTAANGINFAAAVLKKHVLTYAYDVQGVIGGVGATNTYLFFPFRTGRNTQRLVAMLGLAPTDGGGTPDPWARLRAVPASPGSVITGDRVRYYRVGSTAFDPQDILWQRTSINVAHNTLYRGAIDIASEARLVAACVWEESDYLVDDSITGTCDPTEFTVGGDIEASAIQDVVEAGTTVWQHGGGHLLSWSSKTLNTVVVDNTTPGSTWTNLLDLSSTSVTANTPGFKIDTQYQDTISGDVPLEMGVYATRTSGTGTLEVRLQDSSGTLISTTGIAGTMDPFVTSTGTATAASSTKYDLQCRVVGTAEFYLEAVGLWLYEA